jgi:hypothetical protein
LHFCFFGFQGKPEDKQAKQGKGEGSWQCRRMFLSLAVATGKNILTLVSSCSKRRRRRRRRTTTIATKKPECELVFGK